MAEYTASIKWQRSGPDFLKGRYSREHTWSFDGGATVPASSSPHVVPTPWSNPAGVDPEEALVAALSSCHMLTFLYLASRQGLTVDRYDDDAVGALSKDAKGIPWISRVTLRPKIAFSGERIPDSTELDRLHHLAHEQCFIANSVKTEIVIEAEPGHGKI
ncbi:MAG TPA: OsmC family protein [Verrucomicrobiae bacterium]|nr:OsmC family protein [Verrucomicrobiae bacterium]